MGIKATSGDSTQLIFLRARWYNLADGRFQSRDTWGGDDNSPQTLNKWSYVQNNPIIYTDPTGHCVNADGSINTWKEPWFNWGPCPSNSNTLSTTTPSPTSTPSQTPSPTCTPTLPPTATATPTSIQTAISYLQQYSKDGLAAYNYTLSEGIPIEYNTVCQGKSSGKNNPVLVPKPSCPKATPTYIAGTIVHEVFHIQMASSHGSLWEEYQAMRIGDIVRNDIIQAGHGNSSDMRHPMNEYTVDLANPHVAQLRTDLTNWFLSYKNWEDVYILTWHVQPIP